jgi:membrane protein implicated in regulation of membrane protease activity
MAETLFGQSISMLLFLAGALLLGAEALAPGAHFFVVGVALLTAGLTGLALGSIGGLGVFAPIILAAVVLGVTGLTLWGYRRLDIYDGEGVAQTSDANSLQGQFGTVTDRVSTDRGEVKLAEGGFNPHFQARSMDGEIAEGTEVMVVDPGGGNVVTVEPVTGGRDGIDRELQRDQQATEPDPVREQDADLAAESES